MAIGFNEEPNEGTDIFKEYFNKAVLFANQNCNVHGVFMRIERDKDGWDYAVLNPSVVYSGKGEAVLSSGIPQRLALPLSVLRPMASSLEKWVADYNAERNAEKNKSSKKD